MDKNVLRRIKLRDRLARYVITVGGLAIIASVILILLLIGNVTIPLFKSPAAVPLADLSLADPAPSGNILAVDLDEYLETAVALDADGFFRFSSLPGGEAGERLPLTPPSDEAAHPLRARVEAPLTFSTLWSDGTLTIDQVRFTAHFDAEGRRSFVRQVQRQAEFPPPEEGFPSQSLARMTDAGRVRVDLFADNRLKVTQETVSTDFLGNETRSAASYFLTDTDEPITALVLDHPGAALYAGTGRGSLLHWELGEEAPPRLKNYVNAQNDGAAVTALALVFGDISLAVGDEKGHLSTWFPVRPAEGGEARLTRIHRLTRHDQAIREILPSWRDKSLASFDANGSIHLDHMTSERLLLRIETEAPLTQLALAARGNGLLALDENRRLQLWGVDNPHPEISWRTLFGKVWYESYNEPAHVWQSSAANDDFEPKLSLTPLIFGTLKGTFYAMLFAVPIALYGAIYISQFGSPRLRQWIKPAVEVMAAIPSVVIGFLAALWFAPKLEKAVPALFLSVIFVPLALVLGLLLWQWLRRFQPLKRVERGYEFLAVAPMLLLAIAAAVILGPLVEGWFFDGNFKLWLFNETGQRYDPRNSIVIAFALGFAVIPIIFTIAEDSLSNVPPSLRAASLALGASRWQTVWRVILPSASPGIFAAIMIGLGRAIGETMIVLMATGNTPIIDLSMFNGMRPLSSNIAVEIPEAPHGGSLYRVLFLSAVILFVLTFCLNTVAEVVRQRLRKKYGRF